MRRGFKTECQNVKKKAGSTYWLCCIKSYCGWQGWPKREGEESLVHAKKSVSSDFSPECEYIVTVRCRDANKSIQARIMQLVISQLDNGKNSTIFVFLKINPPRETNMHVCVLFMFRTVSKLPWTVEYSLVLGAEEAWGVYWGRGCAKGRKF